MTRQRTVHHSRQSALWLIAFALLGACSSSEPAHPTPGAGGDAAGGAAAGCPGGELACGKACCFAGQQCVNGACATVEGCAFGVCTFGCPCNGCACPVNQRCENGVCVAQVEPDAGCGGDTSCADSGVPQPDAGACDAPDLTVRITPVPSCDSAHKLLLSALICNRGTRAASGALASFTFAGSALAACQTPTVPVPVGMCVTASCTAPIGTSTTVEARVSLEPASAGQIECSTENNLSSSNASACP